MQIETFKDFLDRGSNDSLGFNDPSLSRYVSFKMCFEKLSALPHPNILELGTTRSFVSGEFEGCNSDDSNYWNKDDPNRWDWGAGCFTLMAGLMLPHATITSVDLAHAHIIRSSHMVSSLGLSNVTHHWGNSLAFLDEVERKFDLIYLDTGDMWPIEPSIELQFKEAATIVRRKLLNKEGILLIDDVKNATPKKMGGSGELGKSEKAIPFLLERGFNPIYQGYQYVLA